MRQLILTHIRKTRENKFFMVILITIIILTPIMVMGNSKYGILGFFFPFVVSMHIFSAATKIERIEGFRIGEDILLNSLPVSRKEIVLSRYLIIFLFGMSAMLLSVLSQITVSAAFKRPIAIPKEVFIIFIVCQFIYNVLFIPLEYFDNKKANTIKGILYGLTIYFVSKKNLSVPFDYIINLKGIAPAVVFAGIIILSIYYSIFLSIKIYEKKEF
ncbi:ABC-2 transporter permease [Treponema sp. OMZ 792]|uniref:ABC-2 transporter permease n=1 Tax=unclassified Treponema TaxID=2638727 RepID=UPI0020A28C5F|nr:MULTISPECIES: ABC-2 transporter permease [unclassified Treponema]UTC75900.1 ABC-2 transporter permease [Treponema sp. OMZ 792]UTC78295.1 ABC-2 transporter permease [Treponema sp. OMZ 799]UTC79900.1 ABC-2 transporter permease [Treponema sp. OMZ 798]